MTAGQIAYREYLKSAHWFGLRAKAIAAYGRKCAKCSRSKRLNVHHKRYRWPWTDGVIEDLVVLCRRCHQLEHGVVFSPLSQADKRMFRNRKRSKRWRRRKKTTTTTTTPAQFLPPRRRLKLEPIHCWENRGSSSN